MVPTSLQKKFWYYIKDKNIALYYLKDNDLETINYYKNKTNKTKICCIFSGLSAGFYNIRNSDKILEYNTEAYLQYFQHLKFKKKKVFLFQHHALIQKLIYIKSS